MAAAGITTSGSGRSEIMISGGQGGGSLIMPGGRSGPALMSKGADPVMLGGGRGSGISRVIDIEMGE